MTRGFLLIDQQMNTVILPFNDPDLVEFFRQKPGYPKTVDRIHQHSIKKELDADIRAYLKGEYQEDERRGR